MEAHLPAEVESRAVRKTDVEDHQFWLLLGSKTDSSPAAALSRNQEALFSQTLLQRRSHGRIILDKQNVVVAVHAGDYKKIDPGRLLAGEIAGIHAL